MKNWFQCPDGKKITCKDCLEKCRMEKRCLAKPLLVYCSRTRNLNRTNFSVTEVLSPTLVMYLRAKFGEVIIPESVLPSAIGTATHAILEGCLPQNYAGEFRLNYKGLTGQMDCIDLENKVMYDYKITSAYKSAVMLGKHYGGEYKEITRGKNKGQKKWVIKWQDGGLHHYGDYCKQQNLYRILIDKTMGIKLKDMYLQIIVKEPKSNLKDFGLDRQSFLIHLPKMNDKRLLEYALYKKDALVYCIEHDLLPKQCTPKETWNGRRCKDYCNVRNFCPYMGGEKNRTI